MTTVATPDTRSRMNSTLVVRPDQPARADAMDALLRPSRRGDSLHEPQRPISMASNPRMHASTGSELKPVDHSSPINSARFCRRTGEPEMMQPKQKTPAEIAAEKNADVLRVLQAHKNALTPTEIAWAVENSRGWSEAWSIQRIPGHTPMANTSLVNAVLKRIKAVKVERGRWLKPGAKVKAAK